MAKISEKLLILDFGSQYTKLIARRVRELSIYSEILPFDATMEEIKAFDPIGIILSGGPESVGSDANYQALDGIFNLDIPVLGICYGMQTMAHQLGGQVISTKHKEFGHTEILVKQNSLLFRGLKENNLVWMSHGDQVTKIPEGFEVIASSKSCPIAGFANHPRKLYALQFHPEVTHTKCGSDILRNFVSNICGAKGLWSQENIIEHSISKIRTQVGDDEVALGLSGGVDSSVAAALLNRAIGKNLHCIFVDTGLLRANERTQVIEVFKWSEAKLDVVNAEEQFLKALQGVMDPEQKRKIIGELFIRIFEAHVPAHIKWLAQGTIYPDVIESAASKFNKAQVIKSHHNVGGLPKNFRFKLVEPLRELFKDEVRAIGLKLGMDNEIVMRHPFPGPGLAVRILGEVKKEYMDILRHADEIFTRELKSHGLYDKVSQAFAVFLPIRSVAVKGDGRAYEYVIALRAVVTTDFMTATSAYLPHDFLAHVSRLITNEVRNVSRVVYDISDKPPATIEWE